MTHLPNAPLVYTLGQIRFPPIPMERFAPLFHDAVRADMPHCDTFDLQQIQVAFGPEGIKANQVPLRLWQIASPDRKLAVILTPNSLSLHTNSYRDHKSFIRDFEGVLATLIAIPDIGIKWTVGVALRYIDLVAPPDGESVDSLLDPTVLPPAMSDVAGLEIVEGAYVSQYRVGETSVRFQVLRNPHAVFPPDIESPLMGINNWTIPRPPKAFAVIDTDCSASFSDTTSLDVSAIVEHMYELRRVAKAIFEHVGTKSANSLWKGRAS
jgi:uncharacterized protein (TIGR04255 family)